MELGPKRILELGAGKGVIVSDPVNHPAHYNDHPSGVECIQITEHFNFNVGNAIKYLWRARKKGRLIQDLEKARWYIDREISRLRKQKTSVESTSHSPMTIYGGNDQ